MGTVNRRSGTLLATCAIALGAAACGEPGYALDGGNLVTTGHAFLAERACDSCHQSPNAGDGTLSGRAIPLPGTDVFPPNLTSDPATGLGMWADIDIQRAMLFGVDNQGHPLCPTMPRFGGDENDLGGTVSAPMSDLEAQAIIAYLRSLPAVSRPDIPQSLCPPIKDAPMDMAGPPDPQHGPCHDHCSDRDMRVEPDLAVPGFDDGGADAGVADAGAGDA